MLGLVKRGIGAFDDAFDAIAIETAGNAHADRDRKTGPVIKPDRRSLDAFAQALTNCIGLGDARARQDNGEFFSANATDKVSATDDGQSRIGKRTDHLVADRVAERVIDALEMIDVEKSESNVALVPLRIGKRAFERVHRFAAVGKAGQFVGLG